MEFLAFRSGPLNRFYNLQCCPTLGTTVYPTIRASWTLLAVHRRPIRNELTSKQPMRGRVPLPCMDSAFQEDPWLVSAWSGYTNLKKNNKK